MRTSMSRWMRRRQRKSTPEEVEDLHQDEPRRSAAELLPVEQSRSWLVEEGDQSLAGQSQARPRSLFSTAASYTATAAFAIGCTVWRDGKSGRLLNAHLHDHFGDGFHDLAFELFDCPGVHSRHQSVFFVLSVFN